MPSIKDLEMAAAISTYSNVTIKKSFFSTKAIYVPTQSAIKVSVIEYAPADGEKVKRLLNLPLDKMVEEIDQKGKPAQTPVGHYRLEVCRSEDGRFCALQLFSFADFNYNPASDARYYEDDDVAKITKLF